MESTERPEYYHDLDALEKLIHASTAENLGRLKADALALLAEVRRCRASHQERG
jgi:hypothetical protein